MPYLSSLEVILWALESALTFVVLYWLIRSTLIRSYPSFGCFLAFSLLRSVILLSFQFTRNQYGLFYLVTEGVGLFFYVLMLLEVYSLVFQKFPGIRSFSKWAISAALLVSMMLAVASLYPDMSARTNPTALDYLSIVQRGVLSGLIVLIVLMSLILAWYPISLPRNIVTHSLLFSAFFVGKASLVFLANMAQTPILKTFNTGLFTVSAVCLLLWREMLTVAGEEGTMKFGHRWNQEEEERLIAQLRSINSTLSRAGRE